MTHQEIFDFVWTKLYEQGKQSADSFGCKYRTANGLKCAVGHLIPDNVYVKHMEGRAISTISESYSLPSDIFNRGNEVLLQELQGAHDLASKPTFLEDLASQMREIAVRRGLSHAIIPASY